MRCKTSYLQSWMLSKSRSGSSSGLFQPQKFDTLLALDFEATCISNKQIEPQEIIEFPCLKINTKTFEVESEFHHYVRPKFHPQLSDFCTELTGIMQEMVEDQLEFSQVMDQFQQWIDHENLGKFALVTCGDWDLKTCLKKQCEISNINLPNWAHQWINLKKAHKTVHGHFPRSLHEVLKVNGLTFQGRPHSGIDDTKNIAMAIKKLALKGHIFDYTTKL